VSNNILAFSTPVFQLLPPRKFISSHPFNVSPTIFHRLPKIYSLKTVFNADLPHKSTHTMKTLLAIHLFHFALKAAEHLHAILHCIGHLVK